MYAIVLYTFIEETQQIWYWQLNGYSISEVQMFDVLPQQAVYSQ